MRPRFLALHSTASLWLLGALGVLGAGACGEITVPSSQCRVDADCDTGLFCRVGTCDTASSTCSVQVADNTCFIGDLCYQAGQEMTGDRCRLCSPTLTQTDFVNRECPAGQACDPATGQCGATADASDGGPTDSAGADPGPDVAPADPGPTDPGGPGDGGGPSDLGDAGGGDAGDAGPTLLPCVDKALVPAFGQDLASAFMMAQEDDFTGSCGGAATPDIAYEWVVPFTQWFAVDTEGSDFDTLLYLRDGACDGPEIACNNDANDAVQHSEVIARFTKGDRFVVIIDGNTGASGNASLSITPVTCPAADVADGATLPAPFSTAAGDQVHGGACGGDAGPERSYRFTPAESGLWRLSAKADVDASFDTALYLEAGPACGGTLLQCNGHTGGAIGMPTQVTRMLTAGDPVTVIVDSRTGQGGFELAAERIGDSCPAVTMADIGPAGLDIGDFTDTMTSSCGQNADIEWGMFTPYPDVLFLIDDPVTAPGMNVAVLVSAGFPFSLAIVDGVCEGAERACSADATYDAASDTWQQVYTLPKSGGTLTAVVSPTAPNWSGWSSSMVTVGMQATM